MNRFLGFSVAVTALLLTGTSTLSALDDEEVWADALRACMDTSIQGTVADARLQRDVSKMVCMLELASRKECQPLITGASLKQLISQSEVVESWSASSCDHTSQYEVSFVQEPKGGVTFSVRSPEKTSSGQDKDPGI